MLNNGLILLNNASMYGLLYTLIINMAQITLVFQQPYIHYI